MDINWNSKHIDSKNLVEISRGSEAKMLKYLNQFQELVPQRIENLNNSLRDKDRKMISQIIHQMSPQLQFFGIPVLDSIHQLTYEHKTMPWEDLMDLVNDILLKIEHASEDIKLIKENNFK